MTWPRALIIGGQGRIGNQIARDIVRHTTAQVVVTQRRKLASGRGNATGLPAARVTAQSLDLADRGRLQQAIAQADLVIHCAGPFHHRDGRVLEACIDQGVNYLDVSDHVPFTQRALTFRDAAQAADIMAVINTGVFPGLSNSMVRQCVEAFGPVEDEPSEISLSYVVGGSGGAGVTVLRTTFLGLLDPFEAWVDGRWQQQQPYRDRQIVTFPPPFGTAGVYWYNVPETVTLAQSFPVQTVTTKFGSTPDLYNRLTSLVARRCPKRLLGHPAVVEILSQVSYRMTQISDGWSGTGIGIQAEVMGRSGGCYRSTLIHDDAAIAAGLGTGGIAALMLSGTLRQPGVHPVERSLPTPLFEAMLRQRGLALTHGWTDLSPASFGASKPAVA